MAQRTMSRRNRRDEEAEAPEDTKDDRYADEADDRPARGRSRRDEEADERPARGRSRRSSRDEEDEADDRPRRSSRRSRDDDEDEAPARGRRSQRGDDEDDRPKRAKSTTVGKGWGGYDKVKGSGSDFVNTWTLPTKATLIKILDAEPFSTYSEHWLDELKGKKSFVCLGEDCPLCDDLGDRPSGYALFNILDLSDPDNPKVEAWKTGKRVANMLREYAEDKKTAPLNREDLYWSIFKSGTKGGNQQTNLNPVKARDLDEDWDMDPFTDEELAEFEDQLHTEEELVFVNTRKDLKAIAADYDA